MNLDPRDNQLVLVRRQLISLRTPSITRSSCRWLRQVVQAKAKAARSRQQQDHRRIEVVSSGGRRIVEQFWSRGSQCRPHGTARSHCRAALVLDV